MNDSTLAKLEFAAIREALAGYCGTASGKELARSLRPATKESIVREWLKQVHEMSEAIEQYSYPPLGGVTDIRSDVQAAATPPPLEPDSLAAIADTLAATEPMTAWFQRVVEVAPSLSRLRDRIDGLAPISDIIREAIDARAQVRDSASPRLGSIRHAIDRARGHVKSIYDRLLRQPSITKMLQYSGTTFHEDRVVLPVKSEYRGRIPGIVHRSSDKGSTLFVEPAESVELNNTIVRLRDDENREITLILGRLTQHVHLNSASILRTVRAMAVVDLIGAKCRYAKKRSCICPEINSEMVLDIHEARHPLLIELFAEEKASGAAATEEKHVVPIDVRLGDDFDVLVITGPNTGGKTVTLKTVGLMAVMTQAGIPIPAAEGARMPIFNQIFLDIGDEQSLQQSLSTFSSHLSSHLEILRRSGPRSLVLLDELGAGTDPDEGASIGKAILNELVRLGARAIVTTHLSALKAIAFTSTRVDNASVEFDPESLRPTYHVRIGEPGNSNALIIAQRLGMPARLIKLAKEYLTDSTRALNKAIEGTLDSRRRAEQARQQARNAQLEAKREQQAYEQRQAELTETKEKFERWVEWVGALKPGDEVYLLTLKKPAKVVRTQMQKQRVLVSTGVLDVEVPLRDIERPREATPD